MRNPRCRFCLERLQGPLPPPSVLLVMESHIKAQAERIRDDAEWIDDARRTLESLVASNAKLRELLRLCQWDPLDDALQRRITEALRESGGE